MPGCKKQLLAFVLSIMTRIFVVLQRESFGLRSILSTTDSPLLTLVYKREKLFLVVGYMQLVRGELNS